MLGPAHAGWHAHRYAVAAPPGPVALRPDKRSVVGKPAVGRPPGYERDATYSARSSPGNEVGRFNLGTVWFRAPRGVRTFSLW